MSERQLVVRAVVSPLRSKDRNQSGLAGGRQFGPMITSANITPDAQGRPAGLTFEQFKSVFRTGRDLRKPDHILQVMPWPVFGNLVDADIRAIYEYLRAIPSKPNNLNPGP